MIFCCQDVFLALPVLMFTYKKLQLTASALTEREQARMGDRDDVFSRTQEREKARKRKTREKERKKSHPKQPAPRRLCSTWPTAGGDSRELVVSPSRHSALLRQHRPFSRRCQDLPVSLNPNPGDQRPQPCFGPAASPRGTRLGLSGPLGAPTADFSAGPRLCPGRLGERVRSCPASSRYTNLKTERFKSGDATQYSVLFVCL